MMAKTTKIRLDVYAPWSVSKAKLALQCPLAFKNRYIDHAPGLPRGLPAAIGVVVHRAQELVLGCEHTVEQALEQAIDEGKGELPESAYKTVRGFSEGLTQFAGRIEALCAKYPVEDILVEKKWAIREDFTPCDFDDPEAMMRGVVDFALVLRSGEVLVIDHKTGKKRSLDFYRRQLDTYSVLALSHLPKLKTVQCALHYLAPRKIDWAGITRPAHIATLLRPSLTRYLAWCAERAATQDARPGWHCRWCDYRQTCAYREIPNVESGVGDDRSGEST